MLTNLFHKEYPEFWKKYTDSFKRKATKYVVISMETSGLDTEKMLLWLLLLLRLLLIEYSLKILSNCLFNMEKKKQTN